MIRPPQHRDSHGNILISKKKHRRVCWSCGKIYFGGWRQGVCSECLKKSRDSNERDAVRPE
jgi:hypothetical protein